MRAVIVNEFGPLAQAQVVQIAKPEPAEDEIQIRASVAGANYPDLLVMEGNYQNKPPLPFVPGKEVAGVVSKVGAKVRDFSVGDRVAAQVEYGAFAEYVVAAASDCFQIPDEMTFPEAAAIGLSYQTAYFGLINRAYFQPGETVLVNGATGGFGLAAIQLVKALDGIALAGTRSLENAELLRANGADYVIDLGQVPLKERLRDQVKEVTGGRGADIVLDPVGGEVFEASLRALAWCGRQVVVGFAASEIPTIKANYLLLKNIAVMGLQWSDYRDRTPEVMSEAQDHIFRLFQQEKLRPHIDSVLPLEDFAVALEKLRSGHVNGKAVLQIET